MESPVGMTRWNLLGWFLARRFLWKIILIDCHVQVKGPFCCLPKVHVDRALLFGRLEHSLIFILKKWSNMSWVTGAIIRDLKSRNRCWGRTIGRCITGARNSRVLLVRVGRALGLMRTRNMCRLHQTCGLLVRGLQNYGMLHYRRTLHRFVTGGSGPSGWTRRGRQCGTGMTTIKVMA